MRIETILFLFPLIFLTTSKTILWTSAGADHLWGTSANWDCNCVPTLGDDVTIDVPFIPGEVRITNAAYAKTLTVGGSGSGFPQTLTIQGPFTVFGDSKIFPNGFVILDASPDQPLTVVNGVFSGSDRFRFNSGGLNGTGSFTFTYTNWTSAALKAVSALTTVSSLLYLDPGLGNQATVNVISKQLVITGNITTSQNFNIFSNPAGSLNVKGYFNFQGSTTTSSIIRGSAFIQSLISTGGTLTLNDNVTIVQANIGAGAILSLIGSGSSARTIGNILGAGTLNVEGGINTFSTFSSISSVILKSGTIQSNSISSAITNLLQSGGNIDGSADITIGTYTVANAEINGPSLSISNLIVQGFTGLTNARLTVTGMAIIGVDSLFTLSNGAVFTIDSSAKVSQSAKFQLVPSGTAQPPTFTHNGVWTCSTGTLDLVVNTGGTGAFQFGTPAILSLNGIAFKTQSLTLVGSTFITTGSVATINSVSGTGLITAEGNELFINSIDVQSLNHTNGFTQIGSGNINNLEVIVGNVNFTGNGATVGTLIFQGGVIGGNNPSGVTLIINNTTLTGHEPKTFDSITARSKNIELSCGDQQCQLFTQNSLLTTTSSSKEFPKNKN